MDILLQLKAMMGRGQAGTTVTQDENEKNKAQSMRIWIQTSTGNIAKTMVLGKYTDFRKKK